MRVEQHSIGIPPDLMIRVKEHQARLGTKGPEVSLSKAVCDLVKRGLEQARPR